MTTATLPRVNEPVLTSLRDVERELARQLKVLQASGHVPVQRACMSNLVIFCSGAEQAENVTAHIPQIVLVHPARVLLLVGDATQPDSPVTATVHVQCHRGEGEQLACCEQITLRASGLSVDRLPFAVRQLLVGDLPTNLWWVSLQPPPLAGELLYELSEHAQQVIYDSCGWLEPARGVAATAAWLAKFERGVGQGPWRVASDLNWRRLKYWRRLLGQALDPASSPGMLDSLTEVLIEHGPHAVIQAWELISWMASRLDWQVQAGRVQPNVEIGWQVLAPHGALRLRIRRLAEGPSEVRRVRFTCLLNGKQGALNLVQEERRLAAVPEGIEASPRTVTPKPQSFAELVGRQLSDRESDPIFRESMAVAQVLAQSVLG